MVELDTLVKNVRYFFATHPRFQDIHFVLAYTGAPKASPLNRPTVSFSVTSMRERDVTPVYQPPAAEGQSPTLLYNHTVDVRLRMDVHVPQDCHGIHCYEIFTRLSRYLLDMHCNYPIVGTGCGDVRYHRDMGAFTLYGYVDLTEKTIV